MIIRTRRPDQYLILPNRVADDSRLSLAARGLLVYLLAKPDHWRANTTQICRSQGIGKDKARALFGELIDAGYMRRAQERDSQGRLGAALYDVSDNSQHWSKNDQTSQNTADSPAPVLPGPVNPTHSNYPVVVSTDKDYPSFENFWLEWPKKVARKEAAKAWAQVKPNAELIETIKADLRARQSAPDFNPKFLPNLSTYLRGERWTDERLASSDSKTRGGKGSINSTRGLANKL